ncbi:MAG: tetratricopeptide repeat protein [Rhizobiales bacterium]|nr:tetratricopeptide repeat protein [Hyphomicrobiales bacterium]
MTLQRQAVFISSTSKDLEEVRGAVHEAIRETSYLEPVSMEYFLADPRTPQQLCEEKVQACALFLGIIGDRRGWEPEGDRGQRSITQIEYETAIAEKIPPYMAILPKGALAPHTDDKEQDEQKQARHQAFRTKLLSSHGCIDKFENKDKLARQLVQSITNQLMAESFKQQEQQTATEPLSADIEASQRKAVEEAIEEHMLDPEQILAEGAEIDTATLIDQFAEKAEQTQAKALAYYKYMGALAFQNHTEKALTAYTRAVTLDPDDAESWNQLGIIQKRLGQLQAAKQSYKKVLALGNQLADKTLIAIATGNLGLIYQIQGDLTRAEEHHRRALVLEEELGRKEGMANQLGNLGLIYRTQGDLPRAEEHHRRALALEEELGRKEGMASELGNLGLIYRTQGNLPRAEEHFRRTLVLEEELGRKEGIARALGNLGGVYQTQGDLPRAEEHHHRALALNEELGRKEGMANQLGNLGLIYKAHGDLPCACQHWHQALTLFKEVGMQPQIELVQSCLDEAGCSEQAS